MAINRLPAITTSPIPADGERAIRAAAQRAFFQTALGQIQAAVEPVRTEPPTAEILAQEDAAHDAQTSADAASRPPRPGSLLDVWI